MAHNVIINEDEAGKSLLAWLTGRYTYYTEDEWINRIREGRLVCNGRLGRSEDILMEKDRLIYFSPMKTEPEINRNYRIIHEDENLLIVNKPPGIPCHPSGSYYRNTLWWLLKKRYPFQHIVNRLDRETSGLMAIGKTKEAARFYFDIMMNRQGHKEYLVMVHGSFPEYMDATGWMVPDTESTIRKKRRFIPDHHAAVPDEHKKDPDRQYCRTELKRIVKPEDFTDTGVKPVEMLSGFSLVHCILHTGRTHQIRATLCSLGYPVAGDKLYGPDEEIFLRFARNEITEKDWKTLILPHQALHSFRLVLPMMDGSDGEWQAPVPVSWK